MMARSGLPNHPANLFWPALPPVALLDPYLLVAPSCLQLAVPLMLLHTAEGPLVRRAALFGIAVALLD